jgi:hypothetical protein
MFRLPKTSLTARSFAWVVGCLLFAAVGYGEEPVNVALCQVKKDPSAYDRKLLAVAGFFSHRFEDFTLFDPTCATGSDIWLEFGGTSSSGTVYCCGVDGKRARSKPLTVENTLIPLVNDERFREFDQIVQKQPDVVGHVTVIGRFFSGKPMPSPDGVEWRGYGHFGCCSLFAVQQVLSVDPQDRADLDYAAYPNVPEEGKVGCVYHDLVPTSAYASLIAAQKEAERVQSERMFTEPEQAAANALAHLLNVNAAKVEGFKVKRKSQGRLFFEWMPQGREERYLVVASRPYWLSFYATNPQRVAWVVIAAWEVSCR